MDHGGSSQLQILYTDAYSMTKLCLLNQIWENEKLLLILHELFYSVSHTVYIFSSDSTGSAQIATSGQPVHKTKVSKDGRRYHIYHCCNRVAFKTPTLAQTANCSIKLFYSNSISDSDASMT